MWWMSERATRPSAAALFRLEPVLAGGALLLCLGLFVLYRSEACVVNHLARLLLPDAVLDELRKGRGAMPDFIVYQLPGGLWVFAATLVSWSTRIVLANRRVSLALLPLVSALGIELMQFLQWTDGTFDPGDAWACLVGFLAARQLRAERRAAWDCPLVQRRQRWRCLACHALLFLADAGW